MNNNQKKLIENYVKELALADAKTIDMIARKLGVNQNVVYRFFIHFHIECFKKMLGLEETK